MVTQQELGTVPLSIPCFLAPMAEFTTPPMRVLCEASGAQRTFTEMVNAEGLCRGSEKTAFLLTTFPEEQHVWAHLYGPEPERLAEAVKRVDAMQRFQGIDLNAGCPVPRITSQGAGSALLKDLPRLSKMLRAMVVATKLPVTLKTRIGVNPNVSTWRDTLHIAEDAGVAAISFHARFTSQGHAGTVHLDTLREIVSEAHIPVYGNGSIIDLKSAEAMAETGVAALLIARAALENPNIFAFQSMDPFKLVQQHLELELRYRKMASAWMHLSAEEATVLTFKHHLFRYFKGLPGANTLRKSLLTMRTLEDVSAAIAALQAAAQVIN